MTSAILIIVILGALDAMLYIACVELEKEREEQTMVHVKKCPYGNRGKATTEFYIDGKPQIYCYGWIDLMYDEPIEICKNCADFVDKAQEDLERSRR